LETQRKLTKIEAYIEVGRNPLNGRMQVTPVEAYIVEEIPKAEDSSERGNNDEPKRS
jgi:hypothetical protein